MSNIEKAHTVRSLDLHKLEMDIAAALPSVRVSSVQIGSMPQRDDGRRTSCRCSIFLINFLTLGVSPRHAACVDG